MEWVLQCVVVASVVAVGYMRGRMSGERTSTHHPRRSFAFESLSHFVVVYSLAGVDFDHEIFDPWTVMT